MRSKNRRTAVTGSRWGKATALIGAIAALVLAGCSSSDDTKSSGSTGSDSVTFPIGIVTSLSGPNAELGKEASAAIQKFVDWNNDNDTGVTFEIVGTQDDASDPAQGRQAAAELISKGAKAIVGDMSSTVAEAVGPVAAQQGAMVMVTGSWADDLTGEDKPLAFRVGAWNAGLAQYGIEPYLEALAAEGKLTKLGLLTEDSPYGVGAAEQMIKLANENLPDVEIINEKYPANSTDATGQLLKLKDADPDLIIISATLAGRNTSIGQAAEVGVDSQLLAQWNWPTYGDFWDAAGTAGVGIQYVDFDSPQRTLTDMASTLKEVTGSEPTIWGAWAWDGMLAVREAVLAAGTDDVQEVATAMESVSFEGATGDVSFDTSSDNFHNRKTLPGYILQLNKEGAGAADAEQIFPAPN
jgi:branched-chain amino acid transport system substrate-binding protein